MPPTKPLPHNGPFSSPEEYVSSLLHFVYTTELFQIICGGTHILDFFTSTPGLFHTVLPPEWHEYLLQADTMRLLDILMREDLHLGDWGMPASLSRYVRSVRELALSRDFVPRDEAALPHQVRVGMKPKKVHEVVNFAGYVQRLADGVGEDSGVRITHFVDLGSGQNYLGRALASEPYNRQVVAVEGRENNVLAAKGLDMSSGLAVKQKVRRNKKLWQKIVEAGGPDAHGSSSVLADTVKTLVGNQEFDFRPREQLCVPVAAEEGRGFVQYVSGRLDSGHLEDVIGQIEGAKEEVQLMAVSIHSCGNLSHFGVRSLVLNPDIRAVAIVGCCYNLMTERLGPPSYKHAYLRPTMAALNGRVGRESHKFDPQGFPMSQRLSTYEDDGIRLNITARMMACQAPRNWGPVDSEAFFSRHFYRAVLQKIFLDRGVVQQIRHGTSGPLDVCTQPVAIGGLRKQCYGSLRAYVRGSIEKLTTSNEYRQYADVMRDKMADITDDEIDRYEAEFLPRKKELCIMWSLMAFSAMVVESLIVVDRWMFLKEQPEVKSAWVETVFDYAQSPRNLVVVGVKE